jgi:hypothetical protein
VVENVICISTSISRRASTIALSRGRRLFIGVRVRGVLSRSLSTPTSLYNPRFRQFLLKRVLFLLCKPFFFRLSNQKFLTRYPF